jgi:hypothetical protein
VTKATEDEPSAPDGAAPGVDLGEAVEQPLLGRGDVDGTGPSEEALRDGYKEARADARAFIDLRFKHFTTFAVVFGIASLAASREELQSVRPGIAAVMVAVTPLLFWSIDGRTSQYHRGVLLRIGGYEEALHLLRPAPTPGRRRLPSSAATSLLFLLAVCVWLTVLGMHLFVDQPDETGGNAPDVPVQTGTPMRPAPP